MTNFPNTRKIRPHQQEALTKAVEHFKDHRRGLMVLPPGSGKTYLSYLIMDQLVPDNGLVLYLAPSINLIGQTLKEYSTVNKNTVLFAVCSDKKVGHNEDGKVADLPITPTTNPRLLLDKVAEEKDNNRIVIICTYQSIDEIKSAQQLGLPSFDLTICDEAHRTTGIEHKQKDGNYFTSVNDEKFIVSDRRLYMTATPRLYGEKSKEAAVLDDTLLCSMDDETIYGKEFYRLEFSDAIDQGVLSDYRVIIPIVSQEWAARKLQGALTNDIGITINEAAVIMGCYKGLKDVDAKSAIGFVNTIKKSKDYTAGFNEIVDKCIKVVDDDDHFKIQTKHIDGKMKSDQRNDLLRWLK